MYGSFLGGKRREGLFCYMIFNFFFLYFLCYKQDQYCIEKRPIHAYSRCLIPPYLLH